MDKLGICEWVFSVNGPLAMQIASEIGFTGIQIGDLGGETKQFPINNRRVQEGYLEASQKYGIQLQSYHLYTLVRQGTMLYAKGTPEYDSAMLSIRMGLSACNALNIDRFMLSSFFASEIRTEEQFHNYAVCLSEAVKLASDYGVKIVFESILPIDLILRMMEIAGPDLLICYDTGNPVRWKSGNPIDEINKIGVKNIDHIHLKDIPHDLVGYCLIGDGCSNCASTIGELKRLGYSGWWITENNYEAPPMGPGNDFVQLAKRDFSTMQKLIL